ncbi:MAG: Gfo/Idh/MocA family oxidoreductase [Chloroflexia bacterium]
MERVRVGLIGLGEVAQVVHLPILRALGERYEVRAACDVSRQLLDVVGAQYSIPALYTEYEELCADPDLDAVFVLNSDEYHADCVIAAAAHGKHVLVEKPMCLASSEAEAIIRARDEAGVQVMVAYMRRFAPAFVRAVEEVRALEKINYARIHAIIGPNRYFIDQSSNVLRPDDVPEAAMNDRAARARRLVQEAIGDVPPVLARVYRLMCGLSSHDLSAMREIIGAPNRVRSAHQWNNGRFIAATFEYDDYYAVFETGVDDQGRFDCYIEVLGQRRTVKVVYDTPTSVISRLLSNSAKLSATHTLRAFIARPTRIPTRTSSSTSTTSSRAARRQRPRRRTLNRTSSYSSRSSRRSSASECEWRPGSRGTTSPTADHSTRLRVRLTRVRRVGAIRRALREAGGGRRGRGGRCNPLAPGRRKRLRAGRRRRADPSVSGRRHGAGTPRGRRACRDRRRRRQELSCDGQGDPGGRRASATHELEGRGPCGQRRVHLLGRRCAAGRGTCVGPHRSRPGG